MGFKVSISDGTLLEESITSIRFYTDPPGDSVYDIRTYPVNSIAITGNIDTDEGTVNLYKWALIPASNPECYKSITVEQSHAGETVRKVSFPKAFVVNYSENFSNSSGVGMFSLYIRAFANSNVDITGEAQNSSADTVQIIDKNENSDTESTITAKTSPTTTPVNNIPKKTIPITDKLNAQKSLNRTEEIIEMYKEEINKSKEAFKRAEKLAENRKFQGSTIASNGKITLSGFDGATKKAPKEFTRVPLDQIFDYSKKIGHELPAKKPKFLDNGIAGSWNACHAEKQLSLLTDEPIGISRDMCSNCITYFQKHAIHSNKVKITTDPIKTRLFFPSGEILEL